MSEWDNIKYNAKNRWDAGLSEAGLWLYHAEWNKIERVVDAAIDLSNLYEKWKWAPMGDPRVFIKVMQKYCDEYGALKIALKNLGVVE